ncbi:hypothetical protein BCV69DRAFT_21068 [Microstroma glucosiphilum]|uniref:Uncharacterized protein n=1 Tax=Pseudomicrostroma glucosiphilum TaxID=1684307 RepID=A0A316UGS8_9BASI|nr:hypothetical protein BCV69DRAFT_21068 [Pseudomicrostroma glucosiphilum]PWN24138.1 hypothetical protein BCV69DRAFT_21068 [Pseudomicrostroma glucosiphilum]
MTVNWALDPRLVGGQRSESNRGSAAIISLLSHLSIDAASSHKQDKSQASGALPTGQQSSEDTRERDSSTTASEAIKPAKQYERHDLLRAIERQDHETIIAIRNSNFDLLIDSAPGASASAPAQTPLGYAISLGPKWAGTQIVLTGALSKFVNSLPDPEEMAELANAIEGGAAGGAGKKRRMEYDPRTMGRLRKLRGNLKLAVDHSLATSQSGLLASYVQVLLISGGAAFIDDSVSSLRNSIHSLYGTSSSRPGSSMIISSTHSPTNESRTYVLQFVNEGLKKRERVAAVHDLVENATGDLVLMALWEVVRLTSQEVSAISASSASVDSSLLEDLSSPLPPYFLARDDRITGAFLERLNSLARLLDSPNCTVKRRGTEWTRTRGVAEELEGGSGRVRRFESAERVSVIERALGGSRLGGERGGD